MHNEVLTVLTHFGPTPDAEKKSNKDQNKNSFLRCAQSVDNVKERNMNGKKRLSVESFKRSERDPALQSPTRHALGRLLFILVVWVCVVLLEGTRVFVVQAFAGDAQRAFGRRHQGGETRLPTRARVPDGGGGGLRHAAASEKGAAVQNGIWWRAK